MSQIIERAGTVLVVGRRDYIVQSLGDIVRREGYTTFTTREDDTAIRLLRQGEVEVLLLSGGVEPNSRIFFRQFVAEHCPEVRILEHFGGPATLPGELRQVFSFI